MLITKEKKKDWIHRSIRYAVLLCHTSTFLFVFRHNAMLSQCCCLIALGTLMAELPGEEIDPIVVIEEKEEKEVARKEETE